MIESPLIQELEAEFTSKAMHEAMRESILLVLESRFGPTPDDIRAAVQRIQGQSTLRAVTSLAARCPDLDTFRRELPATDGKSR
jgi:hypothetical protein